MGWQMVVNTAGLMKINELVGFMVVTIAALMEIDE
jgi:hypothetical protein